MFTDGLRGSDKWNGEAATDLKDPQRVLQALLVFHESLIVFVLAQEPAPGGLPLQARHSVDDLLHAPAPGRTQLAPVATTGRG